MKFDKKKIVLITAIVLFISIKTSKKGKKKVAK